MTDRPIIFSAPMVRALLDGRKTQTRRLLRFTPSDKASNLFADTVVASRDRTYGARDGEWLLWQRGVGVVSNSLLAPHIGDRLWVRENVVIAPRGWTTSPANPMGPFAQEVGHLAGRHGAGIREAASDYGLKTTPSIHMPRWASRLTLTVTQVRVQRLQEISEPDAKAEGAPWEDCWPSYRQSFEALWNSINGKRTGAAWDDNPWIVALTFTVEKRNIDSVPDRADNYVGDLVL